ncbi:MAG: flavodoxin [Polaromonas sp.]|nr:flavodoxin [Polaromonas sp.]
MSKVLVVMYSYTGTCRRLVQLLCSQQGWPMAEISEVNPRSGALGTWRCLLDSWLRRSPAISYVGPPPNEFDAVVLVAPIWVYRLASPMRSFVASRHEQLPDVAVVSVMGSRGAPNAVAEISQLIGRSPILSTAFTTREVEDGSYAARLQAFGTAVQMAEDTQAVVRPSIWSPQAV